jgi:MFS family permease
VLGLALVSVSALGCALVTDFGQMSALRFLGGLGSGTMMPSVYATVADSFPPKERGRALGWVMTGWSFAQLVGVPIVTFAAMFGGWRGSVVGLAYDVLAVALMAIAAGAVLGAIAAAASLLSAAAVVPIVLMERGLRI